jgi:hypothetical protein
MGAAVFHDRNIPHEVNGYKRPKALQPKNVKIA